MLCPIANAPAHRWGRWRQFHGDGWERFAGLPPESAGQLVQRVQDLFLVFRLDLFVVENLAGVAMRNARSLALGDRRIAAGSSDEPSLLPVVGEAAGKAREPSPYGWLCYSE